VFLWLIPSVRPTGLPPPEYKKAKYGHGYPEQQVHERPLPGQSAKKSIYMSSVLPMTMGTGRSGCDGHGSIRLRWTRVDAVAMGNGQLSAGRH
jgi:hypothetical protein